MKKLKSIIMVVLTATIAITFSGCISNVKENNIAVENLENVNNENIEEEETHEEMEAYAKLLQDYDWLCDNTDYDKVPNEVKFLPLDINDDGVSELLIHHNTTSKRNWCELISVVSYEDGLINIDHIEISHGRLYGYSKKKKAVATTSINQGYRGTVFYTFDNGKVNREVCFLDPEGVDEQFKDQYSIDGERVSEEEFRERMNEYEIDTNSEKYTMHDISYENIVKYLGVETMDDDELTFLEAKHLILENDKNYIEKTSVGKDGVVYKGDTFEVTEENLEMAAIKRPLGNYYLFEMRYDEMTQPGGYYVCIEDRKVYTHYTEAYAHHYRIENNKVVEKLPFTLDESLPDWRH